MKGPTNSFSKHNQPFKEQLVFEIQHELWQISSHECVFVLDIKYRCDMESELGTPLKTT